MMPYSLSDVRERMLHAWDGIDHLHARARMKFFGEYFARERELPHGPPRYGDRKIWPDRPEYSRHGG